MIHITGFEIVEKVAEGDVFRSFKARQSALDRFVMIKEILPGYAADQGHLDLLIKEAKRASRLKHGGILQLIDAVEEGGVRCLIMEYPSGTTVGQLINSIGVVPQKKALQIVQDVARALEFAWIRASLFHGAVTPDAITLENGQVKVIGLGLRGIGPEGHGFAAPWLLDPAIRNPYMAPEHTPGAKLTAKVDIYAMGVILGQMLTGAVPDPGHGTPGRAPDARSAKIPAGIPPALWQLVVWMTESDAAQRAGKWGEIIGVIDQCLAEEPPPPPVHGKKSAPPRPAAPAKPAMVVKASRKEKQISISSGSMSSASVSVEPAPMRTNPYVLGGTWTVAVLIWVGIAFALWHTPPFPPRIESRALPPPGKLPEQMSPVETAPAQSKPVPIPPAIQPAPPQPPQPIASKAGESATKRLDALIAETADYLISEDFATALKAIDSAVNDASMQSVRLETRALREFVNHVAEIDDKIAQAFQAVVGKTITLTVNGATITGTLKGVEVGKLAVEQKIDSQTRIVTRTHTIDITALQPLERARWLGTPQSPEEHAMQFILGYAGRSSAQQLGVHAAASGLLATEFMKRAGRRR